MRIHYRRLINTALVLLVTGASAAGAAEEWASWRGPSGRGVSTEKGLPSGWTRGGENQAWRADFVGRSTPAVFDGRACATGRTGAGITQQEVIACWDAGTGAKLWERRFNVYLTAVPFNRVGWANPVGDPETGHVYMHGVGGLLVALDRDGKTVWQRSLTEELGHASGYGGRTQTPMIDEDRLVLSFVTVGWGDQAAPRHRYFAFDKKTGELIWVSTPGGMVYDMNTQSGQVIGTVKGERLLIGGNADGTVYALQARTGKKVWGFTLSKNGLNSTPVVGGERVYVSHSEENIDEGTQGRLVAIDATGTGDVTKTHEKWRVNELGAGFGSPLLHEGRLYVIDNSAELIAVDAATGKQLFEHKLGTVGKSSPVWADGKLYATEVNGHFLILEPKGDGLVTLDDEFLTVPGGRYAEIYGSPAVAYGRVYFTTEEGVYAVGKKGEALAAKRSVVEKPREERAPAGAPAAWIQVRPAEMSLNATESAPLRAVSYDSLGRLIGDSTPVVWSVEGLAATVDAKGKLTPDPKAGTQAGTVKATVGELSGTARARVFAPLPWSEDFEGVPEGKSRPWWIGAGTRFAVQAEGAAATAAAGPPGNKVLAKPVVERGLPRSEVYIGPASWDNYTVQADVMGAQAGRRRGDICLIANGYTLELLGNHQRLQVRDWVSELRLMKQVELAWEPDVWHTLKLRVEVKDGKGTIRGKVWKRGTAEPAAWSVVAEDPLPIRKGSPGICGNSSAALYYDNLKVTVNE